MTCVRFASGWAVSLAAVTLVVGCGEAGPEKYEVTGAVTFQGQPINFGSIIFEPKEGVANVQTMEAAGIKDGRYTVELVGGPHVISVRDLTGNIDLDPEGAKAGKQPVLPGSYSGEIDYPPIAEVDTAAGPVEIDIEIPKPPWR